MESEGGQGGRVVFEKELIAHVIHHYIDEDVHAQLVCLRNHRPQLL